MKTKALVLYSGGLDSRLAIEILKKQGLEITALKFILPFGCTACQTLPDPKDIKIIEFNIKKNPLLKEYLQILKDPKHGTGSGINPCKDCKIFMLKKAYEYAQKNNTKIIATGEVLGQRPMSQTNSNLKVIDENIDFEVLRPLSAKKLKITQAEKSGLIDREKLYGIVGRRRTEQMKLAEEFKISFPTPSGGCFLCEKVFAKRLQYLIKNEIITEKNLPLVTIGRHFLIDKTWFVVARNESESELINSFKTQHLSDDFGKPSVYFNKSESKQKAEELQEAYSTGATKQQRDKFEKHKL